MSTSADEYIQPTLQRDLFLGRNRQPQARPLWIVGGIADGEAQHGHDVLIPTPHLRPRQRSIEQRGKGLLRVFNLAVQPAGRDHRQPAVQHRLARVVAALVEVGWVPAGETEAQLVAGAPVRPGRARR